MILTKAIQDSTEVAHSQAGISDTKEVEIQKSVMTKASSRRFGGDYFTIYFTHNRREWEETGIYIWICIFHIVSVWLLWLVITSKGEKCHVAE